MHFHLSTSAQILYYRIERNIALFPGLPTTVQFYVAYIVKEDVLEAFVMWNDINIDRGGRIRLAKRKIWRPFHAVSIQGLKFWMFAKWWNLPLNIQGEDCVCKTYSFRQMSSTATDFYSSPLYAKYGALILDILGCSSPFTSWISQDVPTCTTKGNAQSPRSQMSLHILRYSDLSHL